MLEILDYGPINQPDIMFDFMGFAHPPDHPAPLFDTQRLAALWAPIVHLVADGVGLQLDDVETTIEKWLATAEIRGRLGLGGTGHHGRNAFQTRRNGGR